MASAMASIELAAEPDAVWGLIGGFGSLPDWRPYITSSQLGDGGRTRTLRNPDGDTIVERLIAYGDAARQYTHAIAQARSRSSIIGPRYRCCRTVTALGRACFGAAPSPKAV